MHRNQRERLRQIKNIRRKRLPKKLAVSELSSVGLCKYGRVLGGRINPLGATVASTLVVSLNGDKNDLWRV